MIEKAPKRKARPSVKQTTKAAIECDSAFPPDISLRSWRERRFAEEYIADPSSGTDAAIRAGYSKVRQSAAHVATRLLKEPDIAAYIKAGLEGVLERVRLTRERVIEDLENVLMADANELAQHRRVNCRHCHGIEFGYQRTAGELARDRESWALKKAEYDRTAKNLAPDFPSFDEKGGIGFKRNGTPNPKCPECMGEGVGEIFVSDSTTLSPRGRSLFAGVRECKDGIEVLTRSKDKAAEQLAKHHKLYDEKVGGSAVKLDVATLEKQFASRMRAAQERMAKLMSERRQGKSGLPDLYGITLAARME